MATSWASTSIENQNFARLSKLLIDGGTCVLRDVFDSIHPPSSLRTTLLSSAVHATLKGLRAKRILTTQQWKKLYPASKSPPVTSEDFDITLLFVLLRNICSLTPPGTGWDKPPVAMDLSREADLARVKSYRNELYGHITETSVSDSDFEKYWKEISDMLIRLGGPHHEPKIESLKINAMDPEEEENFMEALKEWEEMERTLLQKVEEIAAKRMKRDSAEDASQGKGDGAVSVTYQTTVYGDAAVGHHASFAKDGRTWRPCTASRAEEYTRKMKLSINEQTDFLLTSEEQDKKIRTDDIFTNVIIERGNKDFKEPQDVKFGRRKMVAVHDQESTRKLRTCSEMFLVTPKNDGQKSSTSVTTANPKTILVTGKAGIGKSLVCQKLVRDWSLDRMFEEVQENAKVPDFQFVFLLTFRQLNVILEEEEKGQAFDLLSILRRSTLLDDHCVMDEALLQYIIENSEKLLLVLDGYEEYNQREKITGDFETKYPNDPHERMPVPALIAKIMKGKMLKESVVLISSRPGEAEEFKKDIVFDVKYVIQGFSSPQVLEYIEKYFKENKSMKERVLDQIKTNEILLSFGHIPVMCFLMCYCIKWFITHAQSTEKLPVTRTELYYEVIKLFIKKHSSSKYEKMEGEKVQKLMHKLSELAMSLTMEGKYIFDEAYLKKFKFSEEEITNLKASGLLDCCPGMKPSPSEKPPLEYSFTHLTIQEFLCAFLFVEKKQIPEKEKTSDVTFMFMAGLCCMKKDEKLMEKLIENIKPKDEEDESNQLLTLSCLYEYKDGNFSCSVIYNQKDRYCDRDGWIRFVEITDMDCVYVSYLLNIVNLINEEQNKQHPTFTQSFIVNLLYIDESSLSSSVLRMLCDSLAVRISTVTRLWLCDCELEDERVNILSDKLSDTNITELYLIYNKITDVGVNILSNVLSNTKISRLYLSENKITDVGVNILSNVLSDTKITRLYLKDNKITDVGVNYLCSVIKGGNCPIKMLFLRGNVDITDECKEDVKKQIPDVEWYF